MTSSDLPMGGHPPAVDVWCNLFTDAGLAPFRGFPEMVDAFTRFNKLDRIERSRTASEMRSELHQAGVGFALIPSLKQNAYRGGLAVDVPVSAVVEVVNADPETFGGLYGINPFTTMNGVRELQRAVEGYGFRGAHIHSYGFGVAINDRLFYPFYAKCVELDVPVVMQVGHSAEFMPSAMGRPLLVDDLALDFPELKIVACHTGWPWVEELIALAWKHHNVYLATTAHLPRYWSPPLVQFINAHGQDKVMWGTDYPLILHAESLAQVDELNLRPASKAKFLSLNAQRVFQLELSAGASK